jgi:hypothetical protein
MSKQHSSLYADSDHKSLQFESAGCQAEHDERQQRTGLG